MHAGAEPTQLQKLSVPSAQAQSLATALSLRYHDMPGVRISPDARNHHLVVMAPADTQQQIANDVRQLLSAGGVRTSASQTQGPLNINLANIGWHEFEQSIQKADGGMTPVTTSRNGQTATYQLTTAPLHGTTVTINRRENTVTIEAPDTILAGWYKLVSALDQKPTRPDSVMELMRLEDAEPAPIQRAIRLLRNLPVDAVAAPIKPAPKRKSLFRTAAFQQQSDAGQDVGEPPADGDDAGTGVIGDAQIQFVPELGQIIIRGTKRDVDRIKKVIQEIQAASVLTQPEIEVVKLDHADGNAVATLLDQLYEDVLSARQGDVSITSLDSPNALLLIGRKEAIDSLKELIGKIDQPIEPSSRLRVFRLQNAAASDAEATIQGFFSDQPGGDGGLRPGLGPRVRILADVRTNSLIVSASPRDMGEVTRLINDLDVQDITATNEIKIFSLSHASAEELATTLQDAITGATDSGNDNVTVPSTSLSIVAIGGDGNQVIDSGILSGATVTADTGANALVVRAPSASMPLIAELIRQLDKAPGIDSLVKIFTIENGDALQLSTALTNLFGDEAATAGTTIGAGNLAGLPPATASSDSTLIPLRFSNDQRTNSIIVSGSAADLEVVESILLRLDSEGFAERITEVIWLRHNDALLIAEAVTSYVTSRRSSQTAITQYQQGLGPYDLVDRDLIVVPEVNSNSLLLSVSPRLYEDVRRLIDRLDRRRPMVLIKVMLAEVSLDDTFEIGGELGLQDSLVFDRDLAVGTVPAAGLPTQTGYNFNNSGSANFNNVNPRNIAAGGVSTFGLGTTNPAIGYGGFVLNAASESVSLLMRTLHEANRLQVLSRPQVMTMDNTEALIRVGRQVARVTDVINNGVAGTQVVTEDISVGLILQVTPRVGADGLITMNVNATRSARDPANGTFVPTGAGGTVFIDDIIDTTAQSVLTAYSGQTVVFGGLIQKSRSNISRRVPVMADIPLLGNLFKYDTETEIRSELLIVMTPMVVNGEEDLDYVKEVESQRMSWCLADVVEAHGDVGLSGGYGLWGPAVGHTIYPDLQPTIENEVIISDHPVDADGAIIQSQGLPSQPQYQAPVVLPPHHHGGANHNTERQNSVDPSQPNAGPITLSVEEIKANDSGNSIRTERQNVASPSDQVSGLPGSVQQTSFPNQNASSNPAQPAGWWNAQADQSSASDSNAQGVEARQPISMPGLIGAQGMLSSENAEPSIDSQAPASKSAELTLPSISPRSWIR
ncbi:MAG: general secretion pathway protein GspD [Pirellulaceae bacterium]|nr:general secretion pathway protein GspD [Pirellulaceae bacterium]